MRVLVAAGLLVLALGSVAGYVPSHNPLAIAA